MKKTFVVTMLVVIALLMSVGATAYGENIPHDVMITKYERVFANEEDVPVDNSQAITPAYQNGQCVFTDPDGILVYSYIQDYMPLVTYGRELILEEYIALPENGDYYERLYSTKSITSYKFKEYMTDVWAKASSYTVNSSKKITWTHSGGVDVTLKKIVGAHYHLTYEIETSEAIGTTIPARSDQFSKLGLYVKYVHNSIAFQTYVERNGEVVRNDWEYGTMDNPLEYQYDVVYRTGD